MFTNPGDGSGEDLDPLLIDGATVRNGTLVGTSHLDQGSKNSEKTLRCQTGDTAAHYLVGHI